MERSWKTTAWEQAFTDSEIESETEYDGPHDSSRTDSSLDHALSSLSLCGEGGRQGYDSVQPEDDPVFCFEEAFLQEGGSHVEEADWQCSICLEEIPLANVAIIKGCEHHYCIGCIVNWCLLCENKGVKATCPKCKGTFTFLKTHRLLNGALSDQLVEESLTLLKRATWLDTANPYKHVISGPEDNSEDDYMVDDEDYYFSPAAGKARVVLGNRRWGENGIVRAGHLRAKIYNTAGTSSSRPIKCKGKKALSSMQGASGSPQGTLTKSETIPPSTSPAAQPKGKGKDAALPSTPPESAGFGRRAKRSAKRAALEA